MTLTIILRLIDNVFRHPIRYILPIIILAYIGFATMSTIDEYRSSGTVAVTETSFLASLTDVRGSDNFGFLSPADIVREEIGGLLATEAFTTNLLRIANDDDDGGPYSEEVLDATRKAIEVTPTSSTFVEIAATTLTPEASQALAVAVTEAFVAWQIDADVEQSVIAKDFFETLAASLEVEVALAQAALEAFLLANPDPLTGARDTSEVIELTALQAELDAAQGRLEGALGSQRQAELATIQAETDIRQSFLAVDPASLPTLPESTTTGTILRVMLFAIIGLTASLAIAITTTIIDTSVRFPAEVRERLGAEILAVVPKTR